MHRLAALLLSLTFLVPLSLAQTEVRGDLKRRAVLGVMVGARDDGRVILDSVVPGGAAAEAGAEAGDVISKIGEHDIPDRATFFRVMRTLRAGDRVDVVVARDGKDVSLSFACKGRPLEESDEFAILYDVVEVEGARLRTITTRPKSPGKHPAILFIQGLQTSSIEFAAAQSGPMKEMIHRLTRAGFVVMRCEKSGTGDSTGEPASEVGFEFETSGFEAALTRLEEYDFIDGDRVFIFGHSMGGAMAPLIAAEGRVAGIAVYGTGIRPWNEYMVTNARRQLLLSGQRLGAIEDRLVDMTKVHYLTLIEKWSIERIEKERPELASAARSVFTDGVHYGGRHLRFFQELQDANLAAAWGEVDCAVLSMRGEFDWVCAEEDHRDIADIVNAEHEGKGRFYAVPKAFHGFDEHDTFEETKTNAFRGRFSVPLFEAVRDFCRGLDVNVR